jgi:MFS family permease
VAVGAVLTGLFVLRCRRTPNPLVRLELFRSPLVRIGSLGLAAQNVGFFAVNWAFVQHTINQWDWSVAQAGTATIPVSLTAGLVAFGTSRAADRVGPGPFMVAGAIGMIAGFGFLWFAVGDTASLGVVLVGASLIGATSGLGVPSAASLTLRGVPSDQHSFGSAVNAMAQRIGATFGNSLAITFVAAEAGTSALHHTLAAGAVVMALTIPLGVRAIRLHRTG